MVVLSTGIYHRSRAHRSDERISRKQESRLIWLRASSFPVWISVITYLIHPPLMAWSTVQTPFWLRWLGVSLCLVCVPLIHWVFKSLGTNITDTVVTRIRHTLVTAGPYRWVRHPLYSVSAVFLIGRSLLPSNWLMGLLLIPACVYLRIRTPIEEAHLIERFGTDYLSYMDRTPAFLPRWRPN
jgi:protein-S-isoprenylcysteine O-methyltransferase Ste14